MRRHGLHNQTVGFELGCWNLAPADLFVLQEQMPDMRVVDATRLVATMTAVKTELELQTMRDAMAMTDLAVDIFRSALRPGLTENELMEAIEAGVADRGGQIWQPVVTLVFGERTKLAHGAPTDNPIGTDEPAMLELGGVKHGYAAGIVRGAVLGRHKEAEELHAVAEDALAASVAAIRPGVTAGDVDAAGRAVIASSNYPDALRHRVGYHTGINWLERGNISIEPGANDVLRRGMTLHMPFILEGPSGYLFGTSQHVVVTANGASTLSATPPTLYQC
ncbi:Xaa-Pro aminopeptidase [Nocardioides sp. J9]|nr:Xaa-Pro aminopeptidase [Nocardioides sp. J9]